MNTKLNALFTEYGFSQKDRHEFMQIYNLLPDYKKARVVDRFDEIAVSVQGFQDEMRVEQEILFGKALQNIEDKISQNKQASLSKMIRNELAQLKSLI